MAWTQSGNIKGASGIPGASGASGASGLQGASGASGGTGGIGLTGATGPAGPTGASGGTGGTGGTGGPGTTTWADITDKPGAILNYKGTWNASSNSPTLSDSTGSGGDVYRVSVGASRNLGSGSITWDVSDYAIYSPVTSSWEKADTTDAVSTVAGRTGDVTLTVADISGNTTTALGVGSIELGHATDTTLSRSAAGKLAVEGVDVVLTGGALGTPSSGTLTNCTGLPVTGITASTSSALGVGSVELGNASDTTLSRSSAGVLAVEGVPVVTTTATQALTNKDLSGSGNTFPAFIKRSISTLTADTTLGATANTDYVYFTNYGSSDTSISNVSLLIHADGSNNATTFVDSSPNNFSITANTNAKISTTQSKFGGSSLYLDGSSTLTITAGTSTTLPSSNESYTVEAWIYANSVSSTQAILCYGDPSTNKAFRLVLGSSGRLGDWWWDNDTSTSNNQISATTWTHVASTYNGTTLRLFVNGSLITSATPGTHNVTTYNNLTIGGDPLSGTSVGKFTGYIDDIRLTKGVARYTATFTAPSAALPDPPAVTLPTAASNTNHYTIKNVSASTVLIKTTSSQTIDGASQSNLTASSISRVISDGSNWRTV